MHVRGQHQDDDIRVSVGIVLGPLCCRTEKWCGAMPGKARSARQATGPVPRRPTSAERAARSRARDEGVHQVGAGRNHHVGLEPARQLWRFAQSRLRKAQMFFTQPKAVTGISWRQLVC
jgi:hypothetical protein